MDGTTLLVTALGGITLLLWGCRMVRTAVIRAFGTELQHFIGGWANNRLLAVFSGIGVGTVLQSSTATALLVSAFAGQGAILTAAALAIMLGADLGAAIAASIFTSGVSAGWPLIAFAGYLIHATYDGRSVRLKNIGRLMIGLGIVFLGLKTIGLTAGDIANSPIISQIIEATSREPVLAVLVGTLMTWVAYSSIVIVLLAVTLAASGGIGAEHLYPLLLGVNIGAALPALSATLGELPVVRRIPLGNLIFRLLGAAVMFPFLADIPGLMELVASETGLVLDAGARIILFHLAFNLGLCIIFIGLTGPVAWITGKMLPDLIGEEGVAGPRFLDESLINTPPAALGAAARETLRMGELVESMLAKTIQVFESDNPVLRASVEAIDDEVDQLNEAIKRYLTRLMRGELSEKESQAALDTLTFTTNLEHVGDIIDKNLMQLADKKTRHRLQFSEEGLKELRNMHARVMDTLQLSFNVFMAQEVGSARQLISRKTELRALELTGLENHVERLTSGQMESIVTSAIHLDVIRDFKRINSHLTSVAYPVLERAGELRKTRLRKVKSRGREESNAAVSDSNLPSEPFPS